MARSVRPIPDGYHSLTAYLIVRSAADAIDFYKRAFGAEERFRMPGPDGKTIGHAELKIGDSMLMLADEQGGAFGRSPQSLGGTQTIFTQSRQGAKLTRFLSVLRPCAFA